MLINKSFETPEGSVRFEGELEQQELDLVLQVGLNYLLKVGAIPYTILNEDANFHESPQDLQ